MSAVEPRPRPAERVDAPLTDAPLVELDVGPVAPGGHCVARHEGRVVFVRHALPGERVVAEVVSAGRAERFWRAEAVEVLEASPDRVPARCPLAGPGGCGGCDWQHASLPAQRRGKAAVILEQLRRLGRVDPDAVPGLNELVVEPVPGDDDGLGWRTRMRFAVDGHGRPGLYRHRSHQVVPVPACPIAHPALNELTVGQQRWPATVGIEISVAPELGAAGWEQADDDGAQRLVVIETAAGARVRPPVLAADCSIALRTGDDLRRLAGRTWLQEELELDGVRRGFRVSGAGFWQVHPGAAEALVEAMLAAAEPQPGERAVDLYSGVGLFATALALRVGEHGAVLAVESDRRAAADARRNLHDLPRVSLQHARVERVLPELVSADGGWSDSDIVVLDPPRVGAGPVVLDAIAAARPRVVVYVACDPASLARDVALAGSRGYRLASLRALDLFPMTRHVECVARLVPADGIGDR